MLKERGKNKNILNTGDLMMHTLFRFKIIYPPYMYRYTVHIFSYIMGWQPPSRALHTPPINKNYVSKS